MPGRNLWRGHELVLDRKAMVAGEAYKQQRCERSPARFRDNTGTSEWTGVHVGLLGFILLDDETNRRWLSEECPGAPPE
jgi:hypothetical protein